MNRFLFGSALVAVLAALVLMSFQSLPTDQNQPMNQNYEAEWKTIDSLERKGLPRSALEKVENLYEKATTDKNAPQQIKALIYINKYQSQLEEDGLVKAIGRLVAVEEQEKGATKAILQSMLAELYAQYLNNNYWRFRDRTSIQDFLPDDATTWSIENLTEESARLYLASLEVPGLQDVSINDFEALLIEGLESEGLRPTLYDVLAHRAIDHFLNDRSFLTEPAYAFELRDDAAFGPATTFVKTSFETRDTDSRKYKALTIFQELLDFRLKADNLSALVDADLKRLKFSHENAINSLKDSLYLKALEGLAAQYKGKPESADVLFEIAAYYVNKAQTYTPDGDVSHRWSYKRALEIIEQINTNFEGSFAAKRTASLSNQIKQKSLSFRVEDVNLPAQSILGWVNYRNLDHMWVKVVRIGWPTYDRWLSMNRKERLELLAASEAVKTWRQALPDPKDFQGHTTEIKVDPLTLGYYAIVVSENEDFKEQDSAAGFAEFQVSRLGVIERIFRENEPKQSVLVVDRLDGKPLQAVRVEVDRSEYNRSSRRQEWKKVDTYQSASNGFVEVELERRGQYRLRLSRGEDVLMVNNIYAPYYYNSNPEEYNYVHFFLDRGIYRPGQTVYFKALAYKKGKDGIPQILRNKKVKITFFDANSQEVASQSLTTNDYGTVNGTFQAPRGGLMGQMYLASDFQGTKYFRVEEYKRPKFEVKLKPLTGDYALGDQVKVEGEAMTYAGSAVDGAKVQYRVVREVRFPWWPWWWRGFPSGGSSMEIANGEIQTDTGGKFEVAFEAIPDRSIDQSLKPAFTYTIYADVTDITGETHSGSKQVSLAYLGIIANIEYPDKVDRAEAPILKVKTTNLDGQPVPAKGQLTIYQLDHPKQLFIDRYWPKPDLYLLDEKTFKSAFPMFAYGEEDEPMNWKKGERRFSGAFDTQKTDSVLLNLQSWPVGYYRVTVTTADDKGNEITEEHIFTLYDSQKKQAPPMQMHWAKLSKSNAEPGDQLKLWLNSVENSNVYMELESRKGVEEMKWLKVGDWEEQVVQIKEQHRGNMQASLHSVRYNRYWNESYMVAVPWSNKELSLEWSTFRDKLKPGAEEEWALTVKGPNKDAVAAELVASMYDASLDQFVSENWSGPSYPYFYSVLNWRTHGFGVAAGNVYSRRWQGGSSPAYRSYPQLNWFNWMGNNIVLRGSRSNSTNYYADGLALEAVPAAPSPQAKAREGVVLDEVTITGYAAGVAADDASGGVSNFEEPESDQSQDQGENEGQIRTNLNETVFFFPTLETDAEGNVVLRFTMNEALTRWKFRAFAHTKDMDFGLLNSEVVTQKELMVLPNPPRFLRESDQIEYTAKVVNLSDKQLSGTAKLALFDAISMEAVDAPMKNEQQEVAFTVEAGQSARLAWNLTVPKGEVTALTHRVTAKAGNFSDGEESTLPILTNRMLVTESLPLPIRGKSEETFVFESMKNAGTSSSLEHQQFSLEFTSNPAWYAVQALPYLMEYPHACSEQIFNRYYANTLASSIANKYPKIRRVYEAWGSEGAGAMESNLAKNQDLKAVLLEETPWVLSAQGEKRQKEQIALLFDMNRMSDERYATLNTLADRQSGSGGFSWFPGGRDSWYITQYIVEGLGHLQELTADSFGQEDRLQQMLEQAVRYIDNELLDNYQKLVKRAKEGRTKMEDDHLVNIAIHYLYARSFFEDINMQSQVKEAADYYLGQGEKYWLNKGLYQQGLLALALHRNKKSKTAADIVKSLRERALQHKELGMYWKYDQGYFWYQMPIETHALMIEVFAEVAKDDQSVEQLKIWLLKNKQTNHWKTTKATANAVYSLLYFGDNWLLEDQQVSVSFPKVKGEGAAQKIAAAQQTAEAGTGYYRVDWQQAEVTTDMSTIKVKNPNANIAWGAVYWQYFEDLDKIKLFKETPLTIDKQVFKEVASSTGPELKQLSAEAPLVPGDKLIVRIEVRVDRDMEYVHLKDMRASGLEPINVLSQYKWQGGLGYYESPKDVATHFFFSYLPKGTYVFEYPLRVTHRGNFSNGISTMQSMYAPEFTTHSEGIRLTVE